MIRPILALLLLLSALACGPAEPGAEAPLPVAVAPPEAATVVRPTRLVPTAEGRILVIDSQQGAVVEWDPSSGAAEQVVGLINGRPGGFAAPRGVAEAPEDRLFVVEDKHPPLGGFVHLLNLEDGTRRIVSAPGIRGQGPAIEVPQTMVKLGENLVVLDLGSYRLVEVVPGTGDRRVISGDGVGGGPAFEEVTDILTTPEGRLLALDGLAMVLYEVDPRTGTRKPLADLARGEGPVPAEPRGLGQGSRGEILVADNATGRVVAVDPAGGRRRLAVDPQSGEGVLLLQAADAAGLPDGSVVVTTPYSGALVKVDPSGRRSVALGDDLPDGRAQVAPLGGARTPKGRLLLCDALQPALLEVDPATGRTTLLSGAGRGSGPALGVPFTVAARDEDTAWVSNLRREILAVDLRTGDRKLLWSRQAARGILEDPMALVPLSAEQMAIVDGLGGRVTALDLRSGKGRVLYQDEHRRGGGFDGAFLQAPARLLVADQGTGRILAVDPQTGRAFEFSGGTRGHGPPLIFPWGICALGAKDVAVADSATASLVRIDTSGDRRVVAGPDRGDGPLPAPATNLVPLDDETILAVCPGAAGLVRVDLRTGDRSTLSLTAD